MWNQNNLYTVRPTKQFKKQYKNLAKQPDIDLSEIDTVIDILAAGQNLSDEYYPHKLKGQRKQYWGCHIRPDWVMVYYRDNQSLVLTLINTGTHENGY